MGLRVTEGSQGTLGIFVSVWKEGGYKAPRKRDSKFRSFVHQLSHLLTPAGRLQQNPMAGTGVAKTERDASPEKLTDGVGDEGQNLR